MASVFVNCTPKANGRPSRPSQSQPHHRRPNWAKNERSYNRYIETPNPRPRNKEDYGDDNFTYSPDYLREAAMPSDLFTRLPEALRNEAKLFILAFAAVHTALERIEAMDNDAPNRAEPGSTHKHLLSRRTSDYHPAVVGAEIMPISQTPTAPASSPITLMPTPQTAGYKKPLMPSIPQLPVNMVGLESPPATPIDSFVVNTPISEFTYGAPGVTTTDLARVSAKLSKTALTTSTSSAPMKNEIAWQFYVKQYNNEVDDLKKCAWKRLEGYDRTIAREFYEYFHNEEMDTDQEQAFQEFRSWWMEVKAKMNEIKTKVAALEEKVIIEFPAEEKNVCDASF